MKNARMPAVVVGLLAVGWWLGSMFHGFGPGGPGTSTKTGTGDGVAVEERDPNAKREALERQKEQRAEPEATLAGRDPAGIPVGAAATEPHPPLVTIVIDGGGFALAHEGEPAQAVSLDEAVARAAETKGDDQGVRVRILRKKTAQTGAKGDLLGRLQDAGLKRESIQEMSGFVD